MEFVRIKEDTIRLDMIVRIREGRTDETYYGRSVRKGTAGWLELHFVDGEVLKLEGESAELLRRYLDREHKVKDLTAAPAAATVPPPAHAAGHPPAAARGWHTHRGGT